MKKVSLFVSVLLALVMATGLFVPAIAEEVTSTPLVVGYSDFSQKFSPFLHETAYDNDAQALTQVSLMTMDRMAGIIYDNAIEGVTVPYNGVDYTYSGAANLNVSYDEASDITTYTATMRDDILFSDGEPANIDDVIFSLYVYLDTSYTGSAQYQSYPIIGLQNYRLQIAEEAYEKYDAMFSEIYAAGEDHEWAEGDAWTQEQQDSFWAGLKTVWTEDVQAIVDYVVANYGDAAEEELGVTAEDFEASEGLQVALGMVMWGFGTKDDAGLTSATGDTWTLEGDDVPSIDDYYAAVYDAYAGDPVAYWDTEAADDSDVLNTTRAAFIAEWSAQDDTAGESAGVPNIAGITRVDDYTIQIQTKGFEAPAAYAFFDLPIAPLHYYGDESLYDYENNQFGFPRGDISLIASKTTEPMGAGPYKFIKYENKVVYYEANELYYKGEPQTKYLQLKETDSNEVAPGVQTGTIDMGELTGSKTNFELVSSYNSNGELTGDVVTTNLVDNRGYGYIGLNADTVNVGGEPHSAESTYLRKGLATVLAVYRDVAFDSYYGDAASVINYPISNTSWAAPQPTDEGYKVAFSVDVDGNDIYASDMTQDDKNAAALEAAIGFFKAAGYTFDEETGMFTEAPEGAKLSYEVIIPGDGNGDHPSFAVLSDASGALESIGITLKINDPANANVLWDSINAGTQELWCAAWQSTPDPDMYQVYHSSNILGHGGNDSNNYHIDIPELDELIITARKSDDQSYRKALYKEALDIIVDQAVEIPAYQRQNSTIFSTERIDIGTVTPDMTTYWGWTNDNQLIEMTANQ